MLTDRVWDALIKSFTNQMKSLFTASSFVKEIFTVGYPKLLTMIENLLHRCQRSSTSSQFRRKGTNGCDCGYHIKYKYIKLQCHAWGRPCRQKSLRAWSSGSYFYNKLSCLFNQALLYPRVMMNFMKIPFKRSTLEKTLDKLILILLCILFCMCVLGAIGSGVFINRKYCYLRFATLPYRF